LEGSDARQLRARRVDYQADFELIVKLKNPVPKAALIQVKLLKGPWPQHWRGRRLKNDDEIKTLAHVLANTNADQRLEIFDALFLSSRASSCC